MQFYNVIAQDIDNPDLLRVPLESGSEIARRYAKKVGMTEEEEEDVLKNAAAACSRGGRNAGAKRATAAEMVRGWKSDGLIHSNEDAFALLLLFAGKTYEALWRGSVEGGEIAGEIAGEMRTAAAELLRQHQIDRKDTERCFEFIKKELSENHARLWLGSVKVGEMKKAALALRDNLIKYGVIDKTDYEGCIELITAQLSKKHANLILHSLRADASNEAKNGTLLDTDGQLLALQERLRLLRRAETDTTSKLNDVPEHLRDHACHVYACGICEMVGEPVVRYDPSGIVKTQQASRCKGCTNVSNLPAQVNNSDSEWPRWIHKKSLTVKGYSDYISEKIESLETEIKKLEASKKKRSASQMSKEDDSEEGVVLSKKMKTTPADQLDITAGPSCGDGGAVVLQSGDGRSGSRSVAVKQSGIQSIKAITTNASSLGENQGNMQLKAATEEANTFETQQEIDKAELEAKPGKEVSVSIKFGQQLGLSIKLDKDEVVIAEVLEACAFKDRVGIGWRIISFNDVPVTSVEDLKVKLGDAPRHRDRVIKFAKPSARIEAPAESTTTTTKMSSEASASAGNAEKKVEFEVKSDKELMDLLREANKPGNWKKGSILSWLPFWRNEHLSLQLKMEIFKS